MEKTSKMETMNWFVWEVDGIIDSFLTEAKDQNGNERSLERLNEDRHLAAERFMEILAQQRNEIIKACCIPCQNKTDRISMVCHLAKEVLGAEDDKEAN